MSDPAGKRQRLLRAAFAAVRRQRRRRTRRPRSRSTPTSQRRSRPQSGGWFQRLKSGLGKTSAKLTTGITDIFSKRKLDAATLDDLEDLLIQSDLGVATTGRITDRDRQGPFRERHLRRRRSRDPGKRSRARAGARRQAARHRSAQKPHVIMMVGVNGTGKTTTIGKLAAKFKAEGKSVVLAAGDTFRAAAIDQLKVWGERTGCPVVARNVGEDASGLAFDAFKAGASDWRRCAFARYGRAASKQAGLDGRT